MAETRPDRRGRRGREPAGARGRRGACSDRHGGQGRASGAPGQGYDDAPCPAGDSVGDSGRRALRHRPALSCASAPRLRLLSPQRVYGWLAWTELSARNTALAGPPRVGHSPDGTRPATDACPRGPTPLLRGLQGSGQPAPAAVPKARQEGETKRPQEDMSKE